MWRAISQALDWIYRLAAYLAGALLVLLCALVLYSIVARLAGLFAGGASDFAGYVMATSTFMALSYTFRTHGHIRVTLLIQTATGAVRRGIELLCLGFMSIATAYLAYYMCRLAWASYVFGDRSEGGRRRPHVDTAVARRARRRALRGRRLPHLPVGALRL